MCDGPVLRSKILQLFRELCVFRVRQKIYTNLKSYQDKYNEFTETDADLRHTSYTFVAEDRVQS